ncbi:DUF2489 domain-containing protein [Saccharophagus sp. K07]|jgi:hypothetical protein|uniref:DUF2489 domain-containing protein n=1 Tax=Saccharophagus sp. K07 TaxID=2283636 RepID=UPI001651B910|nr:DUF2489 domain-containing protein [Saccharophagus sp. K07]MBC6906983.1 DUF2489 domain-containing protein [Saccharophagus sp. K07]
MINALWLIGSAIILVLAGIAIYLHWKLYKLRKLNKQKQEEADRQYQQARIQINQSIQIICRAMLDGQVRYAEASLRISRLMDQLSVDGAPREEFVAFDKLAQSIAHIPILDEWKQLPKKQRREYEQHIERQEEELGDFVRDAAQRLIGRTF